MGNQVTTQARLTPRSRLDENQVIERLALFDELDNSLDLAAYVAQQQAALASLYTGWDDVDLCPGWGIPDPGNPPRHRVALGYYEALGWVGPDNAGSGDPPTNTPGSPIWTIPDSMIPTVRSNRVNGVQGGSPDFVTLIPTGMMIAPDDSISGFTKGQIGELGLFGNAPTCFAFLLQIRVPMDMIGGTDAITGS